MLQYNPLLHITECMHQGKDLGHETGFKYIMLHRSPVQMLQ